MTMIHATKAVNRPSAILATSGIIQNRFEQPVLGQVRWMSLASIGRYAK
jgi:hypothetical protein